MILVCILFATIVISTLLLFEILHNEHKRKPGNREEKLRRKRQHKN